uniref:Uncharacterized protein n=1 Tax=Anopheles christyi TaxID=43041 RepID=A0A182JVR0_9DIPT
MANKVTTDGVDFQRQLYYYVIALVHGKYDYSILYEGNDKTYGALDDVILKIHPDPKMAKQENLYFFQAKQSMDEAITLSVQDMLHYKVNIAKYIDSYCRYSKSDAYKRDGKPAEMIYWTTNGLHTTTLAFMEEYISAEPHLTLTIDTIKKYSIKHWKALFMIDTAQKLANQCSLSPKKEFPKPLTYLPESMAQSFIHEILEVAEQTAESEQSVQTMVKFRKQFLQGDTSLSENAKHFRLSFLIACEMQHKNPYTKFDINSLTSVNFLTNTFQVQETDTGRPVQCRFQYNGLDEEELTWFFKHFIFYVKVPKNDTMLEAINTLFNNQWNEKLFEKYLIKEPLKRAQAEKDKKNR